MSEYFCLIFRRAEKKFADKITGYLTDIGFSWESKCCDGVSWSSLFPFIKRGTHRLFLVEEEDFSSEWLCFSIGFVLGQGEIFHVAGRSVTELPLEDDLYRISCTASELKVFLFKEKEQWEFQQAVSESRKILEEEGIGFTSDAFINAADEGYLKAVELFLNAGFSSDLKGPKGIPVLCHAVRNNHLDVVKLLLDSGADVNAVSDDRGNTPLMDAAAGGFEEAVYLLLKSGADLNHKSKNGQTSLILAIGKGNVEMAAMLVRAGADVTVKDSLGMTARKYAELFKRDDILSLFE